MADQQRPKNPFIHSHDHDHDHHGHDHHHHHHDDETLDDLDPAQQSLSDALRVSFAILKGIMVLLVIAYCFTGIFRVDASDVAIRLRFGEIIGNVDDPVYGPGWHFGWPYPVEEKIYIPVATQRTVNINRNFWFEVRPGDVGKTLDEIAPSAAGLNPQRDGSLLTGDANIVHARFDIKYKITDPVMFVTNVGKADPNDPAFEVMAYDPMYNADRLVRAAAEEGIIIAVAGADTDAVLKRSGTVARAARDHAQSVLDGMNAGITITGDANDPASASGVIINEPTMPLSVRPAYYEGNNAESERAQWVADARTAGTTTLNAAAGPAHDELFSLIQKYEYYHTSGDTEAASQVLEMLDAAFNDLRVEGQPIGGEVARIINEAKTYKTTIVEQVKSEADTFQKLLTEYRKNPALQRARMLMEARREVFGGDVETFYLDGMPYVVINRDPDVRRRREMEQIQRATQTGQAPPQR